MGADIHMFTEKYSDEDFYGPVSKVENRDNIINDILGNNKKVKRWITADKWHLEEDGHWSNDSIYIGRNYSFFGMLAGVRDNFMVLSEPRGIPPDTSSSYLYKVDYWGIDSHSHSYYYLSELLNDDTQEFLKQCIGYSGYDSFVSLINDMKKIDENPDNVRICFFFDN